MVLPNCIKYFVCGIPCVKILDLPLTGEEEDRTVVVTMGCCHGGGGVSVGEGGSEGWGAKFEALHQTFINNHRIGFGWFCNP